MAPTTTAATVNITAATTAAQAAAGSKEQVAALKQAFDALKNKQGDSFCGRHTTLYKLHTRYNEDIRWFP